MRRRLTAREREEAAARDRARGAGRPLEGGEAVAMLVRRGLRVTPAPLDLPFPPDLDAQTSDRLAGLLSHYAFRLFLRGAIQRADGFAPGETTRYLRPVQARGFSEALVDLGLAERVSRDRYRLLGRAPSFGATLEWYVARELRRRYGFDVAVRLKLRARGIGGDLDLAACAEGKLVFIELKSSPPKNLAQSQVGAFLDRREALRPDVAVFAMDTALRLSDKVIPMFVEELDHRRPGRAPMRRRIGRDLWALTPHLYVVNAKSDLMDNVGRAIAEGLKALAPYP